MASQRFDVSATGLAIVGRDAGPITTLEGWFEHSPPMGRAKHWKDGYSARETAKAWLASGQCSVPAELDALLSSHELLEGLEVATVLPEHDTMLAPGESGARRHDLVLLGRTTNGLRVVVGVESKTDETFDLTLGEAVVSATRGLVKTPRSQRIARIQRLTSDLFGRPLLRRAGKLIEIDDSLAGLDYQLLAGAAGTLIEADRYDADVAVFAIHAFYLSRTDPHVKAAHSASLDRFFAALGGSERLSPGQLKGPVARHGSSSLPAIDLLVGSCITEIDYDRPSRRSPSEATLAKRRTALAVALADTDLAKRIDAPTR